MKCVPYLVICCALFVCGRVAADAIEIIEPSQGAVVPLLSADQKTYLSMCRAERREQFAYLGARQRLAEFGGNPQPVRLRWRQDGGCVDAKTRWLVHVVRHDDGKLFWAGETEKPSATVENLEVAQVYDWTVSSVVDGKQVRASGSFATEDVPPRMIHLPGVPNMRDIGGRMGLGGRRIRQGLIYRSAGLNENAKKKGDEWIPGKNRLDEAGKRYATEFLGIKTDIDLRTDDECHGMTGSPLGETVAWLHLPGAAYANFHRKKGKAKFAKVFRELLKAERYPLVIHCIAGADRTGSLVFTLEALLGVDEEELYRDWEITGFSNNAKMAFRHETRFDFLVCGFDAYPGKTLAERVEGYVLSCGFTSDDIARFQSLMLEGGVAK